MGNEGEKPLWRRDRGRPASARAAALARRQAPTAAPLRALGRRLRGVLARRIAEALVQPIAELVGVVLVVVAVLAGNDDAGGGDAGHARDAEKLPGNGHRRVGYAP
jgi:hypothetical protein